MPKLPKHADLTRRWLTIIDRFGEDAIKAQLWHSTFTHTRQYFENQMPSDSQHSDSFDWK